MRLILDGPASGQVNMAADEHLLDSAEEPVLRLYSWSEPTISLGYAQKWDTPCPLPVVRRPSGGRALLHDRDITYAVVLPEARGSVSECFALITGWLAEALRRCGIPVELAADTHRGSGRSPSCLALTQAGELTLGGAKLVGSAQVRRGSRLLQHGSIPLGLDPRWTALLPGHPPVPLGHSLTPEQLAAGWPLPLRREDWRPGER